MNDFWVCSLFVGNFTNFIIGGYVNVIRLTSWHHKAREPIINNTRNLFSIVNVFTRFIIVHSVFDSMLHGFYYGEFYSHISNLWVHLDEHGYKIALVIDPPTLLDFFGFFLLGAQMKNFIAKKTRIITKNPHHRRSVP